MERKSLCYNRKMFTFFRLRASSIALLRELAHGATLKAHRDLDGDKQHKLHRLDGSEQRVEESTVHALQRRGLIESNKKFPAATYLLTEKGKSMAERVLNEEVRSLAARADRNA